MLPPDDLHQRLISLNLQQREQNHSTGALSVEMAVDTCPESPVKGREGAFPRVPNVVNWSFSSRPLSLLALILLGLVYSSSTVSMKYLHSVVAGLTVLGGQSVLGQGQNCKTHTVQNGIPTNGSVALHTYSYCGGYLNTTVRIASTVCHIAESEN
jgi:hypothetical protein